MYWMPRKSAKRGHDSHHDTDVLAKAQAFGRTRRFDVISKASF